MGLAGLICGFKEARVLSLTMSLVGLLNMISNSACRLITPGMFFLFITFCYNYYNYIIYSRYE